MALVLILDCPSDAELGMLQITYSMIRWSEKTAHGSGVEGGRQSEIRKEGLGFYVTFNSLDHIATR